MENVKWKTEDGPCITFMEDGRGKIEDGFFISYLLELILIDAKIFLSSFASFLYS